ncbi:MAG TPA: DUF5004 domain-containing protein [Niabella sp.]
MKSVKIVALLIGLTLLSVVINSCKKEQTKINPEAGKNIVGTWKIVNVTRNGVDITPYFDFTPFSIEFKEDGSYVVNNQAPFVISKNGTWSLDDPTHPLHISFMQEGASETFINEFDYPVVEGVRRIVLRGAPGCTSNTYQYSLIAAQ